MSSLNPPEPTLTLRLTRTTPREVILTIPDTSEVLYTIHDTGRGLLSSKPDYEIFRQSNVFIGSVRIGKRGTEVKLPLEEKEIKDVEKWEMSGGRRARWREEFVPKDAKTKWSLGGRKRSHEGRKTVVALDCFEDEGEGFGEGGEGGEGSGDGRKLCSVRLQDTLPNGWIWVWDEVVGVGGGWDWRVLDELVTLAYANTEKARRKSLMGPDVNTMTGLGMGMGFGVVNGGGSI